MFKRRKKVQLTTQAVVDEPLPPIFEPYGLAMILVCLVVIVLFWNFAQVQPSNPDPLVTAPVSTPMPVPEPESDKTGDDDRHPSNEHLVQHGDLTVRLGKDENGAYVKISVAGQ